MIANLRTSNVKGKTGDQKSFNQDKRKKENERRRVKKLCLTSNKLKRVVKNKKAP